MYRGAGGGGICELSPRTTDLHMADRGCDMDALTGYKRGPGTAGACRGCLCGGSGWGGRRAALQGACGCDKPGRTQPCGPAGCPRLPGVRTTRLPALPPQARTP